MLPEIVEPLPDELRKWTVSHVAQWVRSLNVKLEPYAKTFETEGVDGEMLEELTEGILKTELHVASTLHRRKI
eukprot:UN34778